MPLSPTGAVLCFHNIVQEFYLAVIFEDRKYVELLCALLCVQSSVLCAFCLSAHACKAVGSCVCFSPPRFAELSVLFLIVSLKAER